MALIKLPPFRTISSHKLVSHHYRFIPLAEIVSLIFPMKCRHLDVEDISVLSSTSPSVSFVSVTPCHREGSQMQKWKEWQSG